MIDRLFRPLEVGSQRDTIPSAIKSTYKGEKTE